MLGACEATNPAAARVAPEPEAPVVTPDVEPPQSSEPRAATDERAAPSELAPPKPDAPPKLAAPPRGLVDLRARLPQARFAIGYATADNFTGAPLPGYEAPGAWAHPAVADALARVDEAIARQGQGLLVFDAYRPKRATTAMVRWARSTGRSDLLANGYIAARSQHNRGLAIDLTLVDRTTGAPLDMGGTWDTFDASAGAFAGRGEADARRRALRAAMVDAGFVPHDGEWWHFALRRKDAPELDAPYAAAE